MIALGSQQGIGFAAEQVFDHRSALEIYRTLAAEDGTVKSHASY